MSEQLIEFESETLLFEDTTVSLHKIKSDRTDTLSPMHTHRYFELLLVVNGTHTCQTASGDITVQAGELLIISPAMEHRILCAEQQPNIAVLGLDVSAPHGKGRFYGYFFSFLQNNAGIPLRLGNRLFHQFINYYLAPARRNIRQICERKREACDMLARLLDMVEQTAPFQTVIPSASSDIILETLVHSKHIPLSEIAAQLGYSQRQVQRKIQARYGKSLRQIRSEIL